VAHRLSKGAKPVNYFVMDLVINNMESTLKKGSSQKSELANEPITDQFSIAAVGLILTGICSNCDHRGACVWQHNNKFTCEHYQ